MSKFLLLLTGKLSAVKAYLKRVIADGGTTSDPAHAQVVYDNTIGDEPSLIQSCDSGKATVLYNIEPNNSDFTVDRNSTKYVLGSGGTIISYATDEPAFEFNTDGSYKGLLVEPAATNYDTASSSLGGWSPTRVTKSADQTTAPDGVAASADEVLETATTGSHFILEDYTLGAGSYIFSCFVKSIGGRNFGLITEGLGGGSGTQQVVFDLATTTVTIGAGTITEIGDGWYRVSGTAVTAGATGIRVIASSIDGTSGNFTGDVTKGFYMWGMQVEIGPIATSYIPTTTASVTRNADDITLGSASSLIGQTEGTLYVEVDWRAAGATTQHLFNVNDGTDNNRAGIRKVAGSLVMLLKAGGVAVTNQGELSSAYSGIQKFAFAYADSDFELYRNGSSISSSTTGSLAALATLTDIDLGQDHGATAQANMHIRAVALYPTRLSDAEAIALTTL